MMKSTGFVEHGSPILVIPEIFFNAITENDFTNLPTSFDEQKKFMESYTGMYIFLMCKNK